MKKKKRGKRKKEDNTMPAVDYTVNPDDVEIGDGIMPVERLKSKDKKEDH